uniref:Sulfotransferase n=1 Tax=Ciona intestinalis TaxID=7719 RepID=H2XX94_CIOIN
MKVIFAGYSKTGTKTMNAAFLMLGYKTYDWLENYWYLGSEWNRILTSGGTVEDFRRMYEGVDAVVDAPANLYWEQILEAYPDAKVILTIREEESWIRSGRKQLHTIESNLILTLMQVLTYSGWQYFFWSNRVMNANIGTWRDWPWSRFSFSPTTAIRQYREHNAFILQVKQPSCNLKA